MKPKYREPSSSEIEQPSSTRDKSPASVPEYLAGTAKQLLDKGREAMDHMRETVADYVKPASRESEKSASKKSKRKLVPVSSSHRVVEGASSPSTRSKSQPRRGRSTKRSIPRPLSDAQFEEELKRWASKSATSRKQARSRSRSRSRFGPPVRRQKSSNSVSGEASSSSSERDCSPSHVFARSRPSPDSSKMFSRAQLDRSRSSKRDRSRSSKRNLSKAIRRGGSKHSSSKSQEHRRRSSLKSSDKARRRDSSNKSVRFGRDSTSFSKKQRNRSRRSDRATPPSPSASRDSQASISSGRSRGYVFPSWYQKSPRAGFSQNGRGKSVRLPNSQVPRRPVLAKSPRSSIRSQSAGRGRAQPSTQSRYLTTAMDSQQLSGVSRPAFAKSPGPRSQSGGRAPSVQPSTKSRYLTPGMDSQEPAFAKSPGPRSQSGGRAPSSHVQPSTQSRYLTPGMDSQEPAFAKSPGPRSQSGGLSSGRAQPSRSPTKSRYLAPGLDSQQLGVADRSTEMHSNATQLKASDFGVDQKELLRARDAKSRDSSRSQKRARFSSSTRSPLPERYRATSVERFPAPAPARDILKGNYPPKDGCTPNEPAPQNAAPVNAALSPQHVFQTILNVDGQPIPISISIGVNNGGARGEQAKNNIPS